jgi:hypothetical protein
VPDPSIDWHGDVLPDTWSRAVGDLAQRSVLSGFYLAGGTGLALRFGHRRSDDLDLFREAAFDSASLRDRLRGQPGLDRLALQEGTAHLTLHGTKVSFLHYPYPLLFPLQSFGPLDVADPRDIACMKIQAIAGRGSRRDFVDVYILGREYGLGRLLDYFAEKYAAVPYSRTHVLKALTYFRDAEEEPLPDMLVPLEWSLVVQYFTSETPRLARW